jgi:hypothetical protein
MVIHRDVFMECCPEDLKVKISEFIHSYNEKKNTASTSQSSSPSHSKPHGSERGRGARRGGFRGGRMGPPLKSHTTSEFDQFVTDFKGILSKVNDTNRDAIWSEIQNMHLNRCLPNYVPIPIVAKEPTQSVDKDGWSTVAHKKGAVLKAIECEEGQWVDLMRALYQYTRSCSMYIADYIDIVAKMRHAPELQEMASEYVSLVFGDFKTMMSVSNMESEDEVDEQTRESFTLTNRILAELFNANLITKKRFVSECLTPQFDAIVANVSGNMKPTVRMELFVELLNRCGKVLKKSSIEPVLSKMNGWILEKTFAGKVHYNMMDTLDSAQKWI